MLSYGWVSNVNMGICMISAWVTFGKSTGLSPLDAGQWPKFLAVSSVLGIQNEIGKREQGRGDHQQVTCGVPQPLALDNP